jgi:hypothetical protein
MKAVVHMPKAAVHENDLSAGDEDKIRLSEKVLSVQSITIAHGVNETALDQFRSSVFVANRLHAGFAPQGRWLVNLDAPVERCKTHQRAVTTASTPVPRMGRCRGLAKLSRMQASCRTTFGKS